MKNPIKFLLIMLVAGAGNAAAQEVSIAEHLTDPGFEKADDSNLQVNAPGVKEANGWSATPPNSNVWTSVSYVDAEGVTLGDNRPPIDPAEGKHYLRMFTHRSSDWLALQSPKFEMKGGTTYLISFKIAPDSQFKMSTLDVGLRDTKGAYYGLKSYDLTALKPGWTKVVCRFQYEGPDQPGFLQLTARRDKEGTIGALNIDDFRTPEKAEIEQSKNPGNSDLPVTEK